MKLKQQELKYPFSISRVIFRTCNLRALLPVIVILCFAGTTQAKVYYFSSSSGNDSYTSLQAQVSSTPWKTISRLNSIFNTLVPGDSVLFKRGDLFYGTITITGSGAFKKNIVLTSYGTGPNPVISGFTSLSAWVSSGPVFMKLRLQVATSAGVITSPGGTTSVTVTASGGTSPYTGTGIYNNVGIGTHTYTVTDAIGCTVSKTINITQAAARSAPQTAEQIQTAKEFSVTIYPNPANASFDLWLQGGTKENIAVAVSTADGKILHLVSCKPQQHYSFGENFGAGLYFVKLVQGNVVKILRVIKIK